MSYIKELEDKLSIIRKRSIGFREEKKTIERKLELTSNDKTRIEDLRVEINKCRKEEKFLSGRIKQFNEGSV